MPSVYEYTRDIPGWAHDRRPHDRPPTSLAQATAGVIRSLDPDQPVEQVRPMQAVLDETLTAQRFSALLLAVFAAVALTLASVGIYSVLSYIVRGRSREIGIRTALGARTGDVLRLVVVEGMTPAAIGIAAGSVIALDRPLDRAPRVRHQPLRPVTLAAVALLLASWRSWRAWSRRIGRPGSIL